LIKLKKGVPGVVALLLQYWRHQHGPDYPQYSVHSVDISNPKWGPSSGLNLIEYE